MASIAAFLILSGVSKSGSPADKLITSLPWLFKSLASCVIATVAEGAILSKFLDNFIDIISPNKKSKINYDDLTNKQYAIQSL